MPMEWDQWVPNLEQRFTRQRLPEWVVMKHLYNLVSLTQCLRGVEAFQRFELTVLPYDTPEQYNKGEKQKLNKLHISVYL